MVQAKTKELKITKVFNADQTGKTKERVAVMLLGDSDGNKFDPFLVNKTKLSKIAETARENTATHHGFERLLWSELDPLQRGVHIYGNATAWPDRHEGELLLWDEFSGYWRQDVQTFARLLNVELLKPFNARLRHKCVEFLLEQVRAAGAAVAFKMTRLLQTNLLRWIKDAWTSLS
ncbi:hypothetical protein PPTG_08812 [Phytophthora nicotianae INRA-310]|uniref:DDE-1 domain-containing protein n=1 Tax=Phytophthora nicotianae (strain INRA-310) TaxID=761204 RepID=W2QKI3_PHYN3|nr:hypothetical protein PPTG_08812 [Phytophthora nicotianae INRA-310]ETN12750.1 hypothetical protein PPTG_08812 [Phytophthora nicotianae INRA-310]